VLQSNDVATCALRFTWSSFNPASLGHAEVVPEHQEQQAMVAGLVAEASGRRDQLSYLQAGEVAAVATASQTSAR
jgi:hypothetical protein